MIIGTKRLLELVAECDLVEGLCERELTEPEGEGFDLRVGSVYVLDEGVGFLGVRERSTPTTKMIVRYDSSREVQPIYSLNPGDYILVKTIESLNLPRDVSAVFTPRTTLFRSGVELITSNTSPGYSGGLTFGMKNIGYREFQLELGARIATAIFHETSENVSGYRGQWGGGRISTEGQSEEQV